MARSTYVAAAAVLATMGGMTFVAPRAPRVGAAEHNAQVSVASPVTSSSTSSAQWYCGAAAGLALGAHLGLAMATRSRTSMRAEKEAPAKYVESALDKKLFEDVFKAYTMEYVKGPMYVDERKDMKAFEPGMPIWDENKKLTSNILGPWRRVSSNELAFVTMVSLVIGLWGYLQFNYFDPQFPKVDAGEPFNPVYIIAFLGLPLSFVSHLACYIQKTNGK